MRQTVVKEAEGGGGGGAAMEWSPIEEHLQHKPPSI